MNGRRKNTQRILVGKLLEIIWNTKKDGSTILRWEYNTKMDLKEREASNAK
jgi:hypothetical protein